MPGLRRRHFLRSAVLGGGPLAVPELIAACSGPSASPSSPPSGRKPRYGGK
jgi:hypothetical protein